MGCARGPADGAVQLGHRPCPAPARPPRPGLTESASVPDATGFPGAGELSGARFSGAEFFGENFSGVRFSGVSFSGGADAVQSGVSGASGMRSARQSDTVPCSRSPRKPVSVARKSRIRSSSESSSSAAVSA
ncbi:pentapeptide repeat-containing protein [Planctomonas deserti]|uniref:pentapeptide repeat-containing protein n=1 Tax=Planctomonas deserti TaxID=2144185 RepID=UPI003F66EE23